MYRHPCMPNCHFFLMIPSFPMSTLFPYTTLFRSAAQRIDGTLARVLRRVAYNDDRGGGVHDGLGRVVRADRSEEHTSELQSRFDLVCRLLLEKKKTTGNQVILI